MTDNLTEATLVDRLRATKITGFGNDGGWSALCTQAADKIETLENELATARAATQSIIAAVEKELDEKQHEIERLNEHAANKLEAAFAERDAQQREIERLTEQNEQMRALLIHMEPLCEYRDCDKPGPHITHSVSGIASAT